MRSYTSPINISGSLASLAMTILLLPLLTGCPNHRGTVTTLNGTPIPAATVFITNENGAIWQPAVTATGAFSISGLTGDKHTISVDAEGYIAVTNYSDKDTINFRLAVDPDPNDDDNDGLSNGEEAYYGTDPTNPDTDGDSIADGYEVKVTQEQALIVFGVKPLHKDILLEMDWAAGYPDTKITPLAKAILVESFKRAPVTNPDGTSGIHLFVDNGQAGGGTSININPVWDSNGSDTIADNAISSKRAPWFYHTISVQQIIDDGRSIRGYGYPHKRLNYVVGDYSMVGPLEGIIEAPLIQHELGHNLSLEHGGGDQILCKPNYPSVMNYNAPMALSFTYSDGSWLDLNENALNEHEGVGAGLGPMDWNNNLLFEDTLVAADINDAVPVDWMNKVLGLLRAANLEDVPLVGSLLHNCEKGQEVELTELPNPNDWENVANNLGRYLKLPNQPVPVAEDPIVIEEPEIIYTGTNPWFNFAADTPMNEAAEPIDINNPEVFAKELFDTLEINIPNR